MRLKILAAVAALAFGSAASANATIADYTITGPDGFVSSWQAPLAMPVVDDGGSVLFTTFSPNNYGGMNVRTDGGAEDLGIAFIGGGYGSFFDADTPGQSLFTYTSLNGNGRPSQGTDATFAYGTYNLTYGYCCGSDTYQLPNGGGYTLAVAVPEPATWAMLILGMGALGGMLRRRREVAVAAA